MPDASARSRAAESVAARFTRIMNASTSRWGLLTDPPILALVTGVFLIVFLASLRISALESFVPVFGVLAALPLVVGVVVSLGLVGARARVIDWLAGLPFPIENLNAVLNGLGEELEVTFVESYPKAAEINVSLDAVSADTFVTRSPDGINPAPASAGRPVIEVRIGVIDSKRNPTASNHQRYARVRALVDTVLVPLHAQHAVAEVRIK